MAATVINGINAIVVVGAGVRGGSELSVEV